MKKLITSILVLTMIIAMAPAVMAADVGLSNFTKSQTYTQGQFSDVAAGKWYTDSVQKAYELGLMKGVDGGSFNINGNITIAETIALACRINSIYYGGNGVFEQGSPWYQVYVDYAIEKGIIAEGQFTNYTAKATRTDFVAILAKCLPESAFQKKNNVTSIPDVSGTDSYADSIYMFYNAGILAGSDDYGTFNPKSNIQRSEVAAIVTRIANETERKDVTLKVDTADTDSDTSTVTSGTEKYSYEDIISLKSDAEQAVSYMKTAKSYLAKGKKGTSTRYTYYKLALNNAGYAAVYEKKVIDTLSAHVEITLTNGTTALFWAEDAWEMLTELYEMDVTPENLSEYVYDIEDNLTTAADKCDFVKEIAEELEAVWMEYGTEN
jgi:hypothetical protein